MHAFSSLFHLDEAGFTIFFLNDLFLFLFVRVIAIILVSPLRLQWHIVVKTQVRGSYL